MNNKTDIPVTQTKLIDYVCYKQLVKYKHSALPGKRTQSTLAVLIFVGTNFREFCGFCGFFLKFAKINTREVFLIHENIFFVHKIYCCVAMVSDEKSP